MSPERRDVLKGLGIAGATVVTGSGIVAAEHTDDHREDSEAPRVRAVHASPDAPAVDVFVDDSEVLSGVPFETASRYLEVEAGELDVKITAADDPETVVFEETVEVEAGTDYTLAAIGELSEDSFEVLTLVDSNDIAYFEDYGIFRVVHASPDAPAVDVSLTFEGDGPFTDNDVEFTVYSGLEFTDVGDYFNIQSGERALSVTAGGDEVLGETLSIEDETTYTVFVTGYASPDDEPADAALDLLPVGESATGGDGDDSDTGQVRVAHASPDAPNVDVLLNDETVLSDVPFTTISDYLDVPAGEQTVTITAAGDPETVVFEGPVTVEAGTAYTVAATGELSEDTFEPKILVDDFSLDDAEGAVRVLHASPDAGPVDVTAGDGALTVADGLEFKSAADYAELDDAEDVTVEVRPDSEGDDNPFDAEFEDLDLSGVNTAIANGYFTARDEPTDEQFRLTLAEDETGD